MIEIIYAALLTFVKFIVSLFFFSRIKSGEFKDVMKKSLLTISIINASFFIIVALIVIVVELENVKFILYLMLFYFIFLSIELFKMKKKLNTNL